MLERLLNNRKEWNALKEVHEAKLAALEEAKKAKEEKAAASRQGGTFSTFLSKPRRFPLLTVILSLFSSHLLQRAPPSQSQRPALSARRCVGGRMLQDTRKTLALFFKYYFPRKLLALDAKLHQPPGFSRLGRQKQNIYSSLFKKKNHASYNNIIF